MYERISSGAGHAINHVELLENNGTAYEIVKEKYGQDVGKNEASCYEGIKAVNEPQILIINHTQLNPKGNTNYPSALYHEVMEQIDNLWSGFFIDDYRHLWNQQKHANFQKSVKAPVTIPEPFKLHLPRCVKTSAMIELDERRKKRQLEVMIIIFSQNLLLFLYNVKSKYEY